MRCHKSLSVALILMGIMATPPAAGQSLADRIAHVRAGQARAAAAQAAQDAAAQAQFSHRLAQPIDLHLRDVPARTAFRRWSQVAGLPVVIHWEAMETDGVDPQQPIDIDAAALSAETTLLLMMGRLSQEHRFVAELHPWGLQLQTRRRANTQVVVQVYDVADLLVDVPNFDNAPRFDLAQVLGGAQGDDGGNVFADDNQDSDSEAEAPLTRAQREVRLAELVRATLEPDVWQVNGGEHSRLTIRNGLMIVRAPRYIQQQIGRPAIRVPQATQGL